MPESAQAAFEAGYDYVEFDVRKVDDGRMVVHHTPAPQAGGGSRP